MKTVTRLVALASLALAPHAGAQTASASPKSPVLDAMKVELARSLDALHASPSPPYFLGYDIADVRQITISSSFGAITDRSDEHHRALDVDLRVGSYAFDNTHAVRSGEFPEFALFFNDPVDIPIDDEPMGMSTGRSAEHTSELP